MTDFPHAGPIPGRAAADRPLDSRTTALDRRQFLYGGLLVGGLAAATTFKPSRSVQALSEGALDRAIPLAIGPYRYATQSGLITPPQDEISVRIYDQVLTRIYVADGLPPMMLLIAYGSMQDAGLQLHRPDVCYPASGFRVHAVGPAPLAGLPAAGQSATYLTAERGDRIEQVYFWTRIGREFPTSQMREKLAIFLSNMRGSLPDGVLVRVSVGSSDRAGSLPALERFNAMLIASLGADGRRLLLGR